MAEIRLRNFRCLRDVTLTFGGHRVLIGGNGTGKTSVLEAVDKVFGVGRKNYGFVEEDLAAGTDQLEIDVTLRPDDGATFTTEEHALFETHVDLDPEGNELVSVRVTAGVEDDGAFRTHGLFVKSDGEEDGFLDRETRAAIGFFYLPAVRDAQREFGDRGGLWSRLAALLESADDPNRVASLTAVAGRELVGAVLGDERLADLATTVESFVGVMPGERLKAELRATSVDFRALLRQTDLSIGQTDRMVPLARHSTGLQTLALFGLFRAYLETSGGYLLAAGLEEPEVHLAPHVARSLVKHASTPGSQLILTTHSPAITGSVSVMDVTLLRATANGTEARSLPDGLYDVEQLARMQRELRTVGTEFLFARAVLLCEGPSELGALPEFADRLGTELDILGVSVLPVGGGGFEPYIKLLGSTGFNIPFVVLCDNDLTLRKLVGRLDALGMLPTEVDPSGALNAKDLARLRAAGIFAWTAGDLEAYLLSEGGYLAFERAADFLYGVGHLAAFRTRQIAGGVADDDGTIITAYTKLRGIRKPELAAETARRFDHVPAEVERVIRFVAGLASATNAVPGAP
jgi:putative ATP-dependent endonuclease of OLD family